VNQLAIIVPVLNEGPALVPALQALQTLRQRGAQVLVVDGGSTDASVACAAPWVDQVLRAPRGRAAQMNAGASATRARHLLFLHADTRLPPDADALIARALQSNDWGRFDVRIDSPRWLLRGVERLMNLRSRWSGVATGDQAMFVRRAVFEAAGGFAPIPLMEDLALSQRLRSRSAPACLKAPVLTSGRRWEQHGVWRTIVLMWRLRAAYWWGADPAVLAQRYGYVPRATAAVAILAKAPVPGLAKTRLIPALGVAGAARAQRQFALQTLGTARHAATGAVTLWCAPDASHRFFRAVRDHHGVLCRAQPVGDLGQRMQAAMAQHFDQTPRQALLIVGTDCPVLAPAHLQQAADALRTHDAVLIPAEDGGYVLIGLARPLPGVFTDMVWSTPRVLADTRQRLRAAGARWLELGALWDVDEPADWQRLQHLESLIP
jgi:rSAM/selenodomain-associated transferase 2/rSAM/selenodomain-associated transferase 1